MPRSSAVGRHSIQRLRSTSDCSMSRRRRHAVSDSVRTLAIDGVLFRPKCESTGICGVFSYFG
jgi:hypothetical protein